MESMVYIQMHSHATDEYMCFYYAACQYWLILWKHGSHYGIMNSGMSLVSSDSTNFLLPSITLSVCQVFLL